MKKESVSKKVESPKNERDIQTEKILVENFVALQKVMVNLSIKFDNLSGQISKLLELFEISAKAFTEKELGKGSIDREKFSELTEITIERAQQILANPNFKIHFAERSQI